MIEPKPTTYSELSLTPPPGVAFVQWADGTIRVRFSPREVIALRQTLLDLAKSLTLQAIAKLEQERQAEIDRQRMPLSKLENIARELHNLRADTLVDPEPVDLSKFQRPHQVPTAEDLAPTPEIIGTNGAGHIEMAEPQVVIGKVVREADEYAD